MASMYDHLLKPHQCPWCLKSYAKKSILHFHFNSVHSFKPFYQKFITRRNLVETYICKYDNCTYLPAKFYKYYVNDARGGITTLYSTRINNYRMFNTKLDMLKHFLNYHTNSSIKCEHCRNSFNSLNDLVEHIFDSHALLSGFNIKFYIKKNRYLKEFLHLYTISMGDEYINSKDEE